jgi:hypothetical protein
VTCTNSAKHLRPSADIILEQKSRPGPFLGSERSRFATIPGRDADSRRFIAHRPLLLFCRRISVRSGRGGTRQLSGGKTAA